jgi:hypothetical protein
MPEESSGLCNEDLRWAAREVRRGGGGAAAVHGGTMQMLQHTKRRFAPTGLVGQSVEQIRVI